MSDAGEQAHAGPQQHRWPLPVVALLTFAAFYFAIGPGNYFSIDEAAVEETAQALILRHTLDIPAMPDTHPGRAQSYYTIKGPGLPMLSVPFVYVGLRLDDWFGSMRGGALAGPPMGTPEQPLRWSGRLAIAATLALNALVGGAIVAMLLMVGVRLTEDVRASMLMAVSAGLATTVMSEATHFFQHPLSALMLLTGFWFFAGERAERQDPQEHAPSTDRGGLLGGLSVGIAILARPDAAAAAATLWLYGAIRAWRQLQNFPDRGRRMIRRNLLASIGPAACAAGYLYYNFLKFGGVTQFGYTRDWERLRIDPLQIAKAPWPFLFSPVLSVFLFAPPLILGVIAARRAWRRWPLETCALLAAGTAHLLMLACIGSGSQVGLGPIAITDVTFGPRFMFEEIVLLMPLTLPAFEAAAAGRRWATIAVAGVFLLGVIVQLIGVSVLVVVNEWHRAAASAAARAAFPFVMSESPVVVQLEELWGGRNLSPWVLRALDHPGPVLVLFYALAVSVGVGGRRLIEYFKAPREEPARVCPEPLPVVIVLAAALPILAGLMMARPLRDPPDRQVFNAIEAGLAAQKAGHDVAAAEDYAVVLGLDPANKFASYDLGILQEDAGRNLEALALYGAALRGDPGFVPARQRMAALLMRAAR